MKNLVKLNGAKALSKKEQKSINGGASICPGWCCIGNMCSTTLFGCSGCRPNEMF